MTLLSTERHHEHISENIPLSQDEQRKRKKPKGARRKLDAIEEISEVSESENEEVEPEAGPSNLTKYFDEEHAEALEAFDAIAVSRKVPDNLPNGLIKPAKSKVGKSTSRKGSGKRK